MPSHLIPTIRRYRAQWPFFAICSKNMVVIWFFFNSLQKNGLFRKGEQNFALSEKNKGNMLYIFWYTPTLFFLLYFDSYLQQTSQGPQHFLFKSPSGVGGGDVFGNILQPICFNVKRYSKPNCGIFMRTENDRPGSLLWSITFPVSLHCIPVFLHSKCFFIKF